MEHHPKIQNRAILIKCEFCNKEMRQGSLKLHIQTVHQDESLRTCHLCQKVLKSRAFLYTHYKKDHSLEYCPVKIDEIDVFKV